VTFQARWRNVSATWLCAYTYVLLSKKLQKTAISDIFLLNNYFSVHFFSKSERNIWSESESFFSLYRFKLFIH